MKHCNTNRSWIIWLSFWMALLLQIMPWPMPLAAFRPSWLELTLFYWVMALPHRVGVLTAFTLGILLDLIEGSSLGAKAIGLSLATYLVAFKFQLIRNMRLWQQALVILLLSLGMDLIWFGVEFLVYHVPFHPQIFGSSLINGLLWPWLFLFMRKIRRKFLVR